MKLLAKSFPFLIGLMFGLALGYVLAERQPVPPAKALKTAQRGAGEALPAGHPPLGETAPPKDAELDRQVKALMTMLESEPNNVEAMTALGNLYFDHSMWKEAQRWYLKSLEAKPGDANVMTDYAVVLRNLGKGQEALSLLDKVLAKDPAHWQALYNKIIVLNFDLHQHDQALQALGELEKMRSSNPEIPDLAPLRKKLENP